MLTSTRSVNIPENIPDQVLQDLKKIRDFAKVDMTRPIQVVNAALSLFYYETATWILENQDLYLQVLSDSIVENK